MFNQYEPNVTATITFLRLLKLKVNASTVNETLQNHPDWPMLLSISDSLQKWNIPNGAGKIETDQIDELPTPFMALTSDKEAPLAIISEVTDNTIRFYQKNHHKPQAETKSEFIKRWSGIYLVAEPTEHSGEPNYKVSKAKENYKILGRYSAITAVLVFLFLFMYRAIETAGRSLPFSTTAVYIQYVIQIAGIVITTLLLWYEIDKANPVLQKVCTGIIKGNCDAILTGKKAKVFKWLSWSEIGFFYFTGNLLLLLFADNLATAVNVLAGINILSISYTIFSIYYQWRIAKQWCVLCLAVQTLLIAGFISAIYYKLLFPFSGLSFSFVANAMLFYLVPMLLWYTVKPYLSRLAEAKHTKKEHLRIKFNTEIFETLLKKQKTVALPAEGLGIDIGNPAAANILIKICNPYCGPCGKAHPKIEALVNQNPNIKAKIIFTPGSNPDDKINKPIKHLLTIAATSSEAVTKQALNDWYLPVKKDYDAFAKKYPESPGGMADKYLYASATTRSINIDRAVQSMDEWCAAVKIEQTPTYFINGYQLPNAYGIEDLEYFLLE
jgi:hypothetical protein